MLDDLLIRSLVAACGVAVLAGMLGVFVVWRRMAYLGDAMGHGALVGVVCGLIVGLQPTVSVILFAMVFGLLLTHVGKDRRVPFDAMLVVLSSAGLAGGLLLVNILPSQPVDVFGYLFGDVLAISKDDLLFIYGALAAQAVLLTLCWRPFMRMVLHSDVAQVEGVAVNRLNLLLTVLTAITVSISLQVVGMLLVTALLVIPPLTARNFSSTPRQMLFLSMGVGLVASVLGVNAAFAFDLPVGPAIVLAAAGLFVASRLTAKA